MDYIFIINFNQKYIYILISDKKLMTFEKYCESDEFKKKYSDSEEYKLCLKNYLYNYEEKLKSTKERKPRKKRNNNIFGNNNIKQNETLIQDKEIKSNSFVINK